ncbi:MFS transporter [Pyrococcus yayanosii]|uniref:Efflux transport protein n=1 Tax=Pyrococcus yayanosii (strain CH1 / JCM 16557) TaxID=529709 RepID=F8AEM1_PYRYC|nr:MFS transporter [Pyrococcus yayanosii]AEH24701.1 efflux transport protein [Pyrococcus yayanosii CH1]
MKRELSLIQGLRERAGKVRRRSIARRNMLFLAISMFFANMSWGIAFPYLSVYMRMIGGTMFLVGMLSVVFNVTSTAFQYPFGYLSDKTGRRKPFIALGVLSSGATYALVAFIASPPLLLGFRALQGALSASLAPAHSALISELATRVGSAFGFFSFVENMGYMAGNFLGGIVVRDLGIRKTFMLASTFSLLSILFLFPIREKSTGKRSYSRPIVVQEGRESEKVSFEGAAFRRLMKGKLGRFYLSIFFVMIASGEVYSTVSVYFGERFGEEFVGLFFGIDSLAAALSSIAIGRLIDKYGPELFYRAAIVGYMLTFLGYAFAKTVPIMVAISALSGVKWAMTLSSSSTYVAMKVSQRERGQGMGLLNTMMSLGWAIGPLLGGYLSGISFRLMFLSTLVPLFVALILTGSPISSRRRPSP